MNKNVQISKQIILFTIPIVLLFGCNKKNSNQVSITTINSKTGNYTLNIGSSILSGNTFGFANNGSNQITETQTLELYLGSSTSRLSIFIENPLNGATYSKANVNDVFSVSVTNTVSNNQEIYSSGNSTNLQIKITALSSTSAKGTINGSLKNVNNSALADLVISDGQFEVNF